jgi:ribose-phosphate pyrophosphokinase
MTETAGTLTTAAKTLKAVGARRIYAAVSHAILNPKALERLKDSDISELITTNSTPITNTDGVPITVLDISELLGEGIKRIHYGESVSSLFQVGKEGKSMKL